jgi:menaquinol-cytochrome c reductase iron-sulfur subunit
MPKHARAYDDPGTPEEQSRRQFLANATLGIGGVIGLAIAVPCAVSLVPESLWKPKDPKVGGGPVWTPVSAADLKALEASSNTPVQLHISFSFADGYLPPAADEQFVWGVKLSPAQVANFQKDRPDLFAHPAGKVDYPAVNMNFVVFSSICPHLGCKFNWNADAKRFICPCHNSQFDIEGAKLSGPAPRGLDPLPLREKSGTAEVTWIQYKSQQPDRLIVAYS